MESAVIAVVGTLLGAVVGTLGAYFTQTVAYQREATERERELKRETYLQWLTRVHAVFTQVGQASRQHRAGPTDLDEYAEAVHSVPIEPAQVALEHLRMVSNQEVAAAAARMWTHLRREPVPTGRDGSASGWEAWREGYWVLRREFLDAVRVDLGLAKLDWEEVGVGRHYRTDRESEQ